MVVVVNQPSVLLVSEKKNVIIMLERFVNLQPNISSVTIYLILKDWFSLVQQLLKQTVMNQTYSINVSKT
jgi:hypothetical protein